MAQAKDVVCGMAVDTETAPAKTEYKGRTYYFCAPGCKAAFEREPGKYLKKTSGGKKMKAAGGEKKKPASGGVKKKKPASGGAKKRPGVAGGKKS